MTRRQRPPNTFDVGLQHERTALAWERTSIATMVAGILFARFAAGSASIGLALLGLGVTAFGAGLLVWAGTHYEDLHGPLRDGASVVHPRIATVVGLVTVAFTGLALVVAVAVTLSDA